MLWATPWSKNGIRCAAAAPKEGLRMMDKVPFFDSDPKEPNKSDPVAIRPKAAFQWPSDCLLRFMEHKSEDDT